MRIEAKLNKIMEAFYSKTNFLAKKGLPVVIIECEDGL